MWNRRCQTRGVLRNAKFVGCESLSKLIPGLLALRRFFRPDLVGSNLLSWYRPLVGRPIFRTRRLSRRNTNASDTQVSARDSRDRCEVGPDHIDGLLRPIWDSAYKRGRESFAGAGSAAYASWSDLTLGLARLVRPPAAAPQSTGHDEALPYRDPIQIHPSLGIHPTASGYSNSKSRFQRFR
jgi:hypothetical protein